jgi:hypothetical protein
LIAAVGLLAPAVLLAAVAPERPPDPRVLLLPEATVDPRASQAAAGFVARRGGRWDFAMDPRTGRPVRVEGSGIPLGAAPTLDALEGPALAFLAAEADLLRPEQGELDLDRAHSSVREGGRLVSLYFDWSIDGVPVEHAHVFLRINSGNVTQFGAPLVGTPPADVRPVLNREDALEALMAYSGDGEAFRLVEEPRLLLQPEDAGPELDYRLVWRTTYRVPGRIENWEGRVDAKSGQVVGFRDVNAYGRVTGGVFPRSVYEQNEVVVPLPRASVVHAGQTLVADEAGGFGYTGGAASSGLDGRWFDTACQTCTNPVAPGVSVTVGTGQLDFGTGGLDDAGNGRSSRPERNSFYHLNQARRVAAKWLPEGGLPYLFQTLASNVNLPYTCNAYYDGAVNTFRSGGGCNNSGEIADIVIHEWGHGLDLNTRGADGASGEATADVVAMHVSHSAVIGPGFETDGTPLRNIDPNGPRGLLTTQNIGTKCSNVGDLGPLGYEVHCEGEIFGQTAWDLAQSLVAAEGQHTGWRIAERLFFTSLPDAGGYLPTSISPMYNALLNADDDDGNLTNGTPHAGLIHAAFSRHGIAGTLRPTSPACTRPAQPAVSVVPGCTGFNLSWSAVAGATKYEVLRGELRLDQALFPVATVPAGQTSYTDATVAPGMDYWYVVMAINASSCESRIENLVPARLPDRPEPSLVAAVVDDTPRGNRSGFADPGEEVDLRLDLRNVGLLPASIVTGTLVAMTPGVELLDAQAAWGSLAPGQTKTNLDTLRFRTDAAQLPCGSLLEFRLVADAAAGCSVTSAFEVELGDGDVCDPTPPCFVPPTFAGIETAGTGTTCAETILGWQPGATHCQNAQVRYNVYRSTTTPFVPSPATRVAMNVTGTTFADTLLEPGVAYHYIVRANDSRSGEDANLVTLSAQAGNQQDVVAPAFAGIVSAVEAADCGTAVLSWAPGFEACSAPVSYEIYRSTNPSFVPGPANRIGSSLSTTFVDVAPVPNSAFTYVVRARDGAGNESANTERRTLTVGATDRTLIQTGFEFTPDAWSVVAPNNAVTGNWEWGAPEPLLPEQLGSCAGGAACWITGLMAILPAGGNNDVDGGTTTLLSRRYGILGAVDPVIRYTRWFTNDLGGGPGEDPLRVEVSANDGSTWTTLEIVGAGTPLAWVPVEIPLPAGMTASSAMRVRFTAADLNVGSLVEAGVDDFKILDRGQGCTGCPPTVPPVATIHAVRAGDDVALDWSADPSSATRFVVYSIGGADFSQAVRVGTTTTKGFLHEGAAVAPVSYFYLVSAIDVCGKESALE